MRSCPCALVVAAAVVGAALPANGQGFAVELEVVAEGLDRPVGFVRPGDGSGRMFIVEQGGVIKVLQGATVLAEPFLDLSNRVSTVGTEQGLLGLAFHPRFADNGYFFVNYTATDDATVVSRFEMDGADPDRADAASEQILLTVDQPFRNHNAGDIAFGPDGYLYITMGDGGSGGDPQNHGQRLETLLGTILRADVDSEPDPGLAYRIPPDNPFVGVAEARDEIWAYGLRNPWRISFDRATGDLFIADVGQSTREEVNFQPAVSPGGENYGWRVLEGTHCHRDEPPGACAEYLDGGSTLPILEYATRQQGNCSITGGYRYRGPMSPRLDGVYVFGDYCSGRIWGAVPGEDGEWDFQLLVHAPFQISSFGEDELGELYVVEHAAGTSGRVHRLELAADLHEPPPAPGSPGRDPRPLDREEEFEPCGVECG